MSDVVYLSTTSLQCNAISHVVSLTQLFLHIAGLLLVQNVCRFCAT